MTPPSPSCVCQNYPMPLAVTALWRADLQRASVYFWGLLLMVWGVILCSCSGWLVSFGSFNGKNFRTGVCENTENSVFPACLLDVPMTELSVSEKNAMKQHDFFHCSGQIFEFLIKCEKASQFWLALSSTEKHLHCYKTTFLRTMISSVVFIIGQEKMFFLGLGFLTRLHWVSGDFFILFQIWMSSVVLDQSEA